MKDKEYTEHYVKFRNEWYELNETDGILYKVFEDKKTKVMYKKEIYALIKIKGLSKKELFKYTK